MCKDIYFDEIGFALEKCDYLAKTEFMLDLAVPSAANTNFSPLQLSITCISSHFSSPILFERTTTLFYTIFNYFILEKKSYF